MTDMTIPRLTADRRYPPLPTSAIPKPYRFGRASLAVSALALGVYLASMAVHSAPPAEVEDAAAEQAAEELAAVEEAPVATDTEPAEQVQFAYVVAPDLVEAAQEAGATAEEAREDPINMDAPPAATDSAISEAIQEMIEQALQEEAPTSQDPMSGEIAEASSFVDETVPSEGGSERPAIGLPDLARPGVADAWLARGVIVLTLETSRGVFVATRPAGDGAVGSAYTDLVILRPEDVLTRPDLVQRSNMRLRSTLSAIPLARLETELALQHEALDISAPPAVHFSDRAADQIMALIRDVEASLAATADGAPPQPGDIRVDICFDGPTPRAQSVADRATGQEILRSEGCE